MKRGPLLLVLLLVATGLTLLVWWVRWTGASAGGALGIEGRGGESPQASPSVESLSAARGSDGERAAVVDSGAPADPPAASSPSSVPAPPETAHAPVSLLLEDERTGEAVVHFSVGLWGPDGTRERLSSDATGALETAAAFPPGPLRLTPRDHPGPRAEQGQAVALMHPGAGGVGRVALPIGPTYPLDLVRPADLGAAPLGARLRRATDVRRTSGAQKLRGVRTEEGEWVRFARGDVRRRPAAGGAGAWVLEVASYDGRFSGSAEVDAIVGVHPRPVRIELRPRSVLRGRATVAGEGVSGVSVTLRRADGIDGAWSDRSFKDGTFELRWLEPGPHTLTAVSQRFDPLVREVFVEPGEGGRVELRLSPKTVAGEVRGVLRSRTGAFGRGGKAEGALQRVALRSTEGTGWRTETIVHWSETPEGSVGEFTFPDVPRGSYAVTPAPFRYLSWEPSSLAIEPPAAGLEFVLADGGGVGDLALVARDAADGRALSGTVLHLVALGRELSFDDLAPGAVFLRGWPGESAFSWTVECPGYAPRSGSSSTFSDSPDPAGPRTLAVSLERGWGATFVAVGLDDLEVESPLSGVEVRLDGEPVGVTDAAGRLAARAPRRPTRAALSLAGWRLLDGDLAPDGSFTPRRARVTARFTRLR